MKKIRKATPAKLEKAIKDFAELEKEISPFIKPKKVTAVPKIGKWQSDNVSTAQISLQRLNKSGK